MSVNKLVLSSQSMWGISELGEKMEERKKYGEVEMFVKKVGAPIHLVIVIWRKIWMLTTLTLGKQS